MSLQVWIWSRVRELVHFTEYNLYGLRFATSNAVSPQVDYGVPVSSKHNRCHPKHKSSRQIQMSIKGIIKTPETHSATRVSAGTKVDHRRLHPRSWRFHLSSSPHQPHPHPHPQLHPQLQHCPLSPPPPSPSHPLFSALSPSSP